MILVFHFSEISEGGKCILFHCPSCQSTHTAIGQQPFTPMDIWSIGDVHHSDAIVHLYSSPRCTRGNSRYTMPSSHHTEQCCCSLGPSPPARRPPPVLPQSLRMRQAQLPKYLSNPPSHTIYSRNFSYFLTQDKRNKSSLIPGGWKKAVPV